jgi:tRNA(fMet)-specific endonuclease VapC
MKPSLTHLLDTSVCSQPLKRQPNEAALDRWDQLGQAAATAEACLAEIEWGLHKLGSERRWIGFHEDILPTVTALPVKRETWGQFARMKARQEAIGRPVPDLDLLIAACAVQHNLILATLDTNHFALIEGLRWEDWST